MGIRANRIVLISLLGIATLASAAMAQPSREDRAAATALFDEARALVKDKKFAEACPKFEESNRLDPGMGTLYNLADCYEKLGKTASAWSGFRDVADQARLVSMKDREEDALARAKAIEARLPRVRLLIPKELAGAKIAVLRDGIAMTAALVGTAVPLDPGKHKIRVEAIGYEAWETDIVLEPKGGTIDLQVPMPKRVAIPETTASATATAAPTLAPTSDPTSAPTVLPTAAPTAPRPWQRPLGIAVGVVGLAGLGIGSAFGFMAKSTYDASNESNCHKSAVPGELDQCNPEGLAQREDAVSKGNIATALFIPGAVLLAAGVVLIVAAPSAPSAGSAFVRPSISDVQVSAGPGGVLVRGKF